MAATWARNKRWHWIKATAKSGPALIFPRVAVLRKTKKGAAALSTVIGSSHETMMLIMLPIVGGIPTGYAYAAARARRFLNSPRRVQAMNRTAGTMMIGAGVTVAVR